MALTVGRYGAQLFGPVARFVAGVTAAHLLMIALYLTLLKLFAGRSPVAFLKQTGSLWATTVATTSSLASLTVALEEAEKLRLPRSIYAFTLPLGIQINKDGTAILLASVVLFTAQATGMTLTGADLFTVVLLGCPVVRGIGRHPGRRIRGRTHHGRGLSHAIGAGRHRRWHLSPGRHGQHHRERDGQPGGLDPGGTFRAGQSSRAGRRLMTTTARLMTVLIVAVSSACGAASVTTPPAVVALARASQDDASSELAAGLALETAVCGQPLAGRMWGLLVAIAMRW